MRTYFTFLSSCRGQMHPADGRNIILRYVIELMKYFVRFEFIILNLLNRYSFEGRFSSILHCVQHSNNTIRLARSGSDVSHFSALHQLTFMAAIQRARVSVLEKKNYSRTTKKQPDSH